jgi:hypothetical protein
MSAPLIHAQLWHMREGIVGSALHAGWGSEDRLTLRNERYPSERKSAVKPRQVGISGQTRSLPDPLDR